MKKVTKPQIMRDLRDMKATQIQAKKEANEKTVLEYKREIVSKYQQPIKGLITKLEPIFAEIENFQNELRINPDISMRIFYKGDFINSFTSEESVYKYICNNATWFRGGVQVLKDKLYNEVVSLEREWDTLLINCSTMTVKDLRQFLDDNNIELPCMKAESQEKAIAVVNVDLDLLFGGNRNAK